MSRTYRNKLGRKHHCGCHTYDDVLTEDVWVDFKRIGVRNIDPESKEGKKIIAKFHSESKNWGNSHGPGWWLNLSCQRPHRRDANRQIQKWISDDEFEVQILNKPKREYWD